jgi:hypothetical protein
LSPKSWKEKEGKGRKREGRKEGRTDERKEQPYDGALSIALLESILPAIELTFITLDGSRLPYALKEDACVCEVGTQQQNDGKGW